MPALICGSLAFDTIMVFKDRFKNHILPDKVHILNVAVPGTGHAPRVRWLRRQYRLQPEAAGWRAAAMATVGDDFGPYREHLDNLGISLDRSGCLPELFTAQAFITTDLDDNQITAFHPGAMKRSHQNDVRDVEGVELRHRRAGRARGDDAARRRVRRGRHPVHFRSRPGHAAVQGEDFRSLIEQANYVTVNDYESHLLQERTGWSVKDIAERVEPTSSRAARKARWSHAQGALEIPPPRRAGGRSHRLRRCLPRRPGATGSTTAWTWPPAAASPR